LVSNRLVLVRLPQLLADLVHDLCRGQPGVRVRVTEFGRHELARAMAEARSGVVIVAVDDLRDFIDDCARALESREPVVMGIRPDGREAWVVELSLNPRSLGEVSPAGLSEAVAQALHGRAT